MNSNRDLTVFRSANPIALPPEVWYLIFEQIWLEAHIDPETKLPQDWPEQSVAHWFGSLRSLSRNFDWAITPFVFEDTHLSSPEAMQEMEHKGTTTTQRSIQWGKFKEKIYRHVKYLIVPTTANTTMIDAIAKIISKSHKLLQVKLINGSLTKSQVSADDFHPALAAYLGAFLRNDMYFRIINHNSGLLFSKPEVRPVNVEGVEDLYAATSSQSLESESQPYPSPRLESLIVRDLRTKSQTFDFYTSEAFNFHFPPMRQLGLMSYIVTNPADEYALRWDFSRLDYLFLGKMDWVSFLTMVHPQSLSVLRQLILKHHIRNHNLEHPQDGMTHLFQRLNQLETLKVWDRRWHKVVPPALITQIGSSLRFLVLTGIFNTSEYVSMSVMDLESIRIECPRISVLGIDWTNIPSERQQFLDTLASFSEVNTYTLYCIESIQVEGTPLDSTDPDYDSAWILIDYLLKNNRGKTICYSIVKLHHSVPPPNWHLMDEQRGTENPPNLKLREFYCTDGSGIERLGDVRVGDVPVVAKVQELEEGIEIDLSRTNSEDVLENEIQ
ncbi:uncharacterized protein LY89DRAFT_766271 [Mollisia scopiformis]|uniref:Uncharacterized protein n=1 Tax=Mollisia scopiformis TaxID=149040 RepID=A0A132B5B4_MOLSC|nr:uncharacterized protein LY89DRAFT_766271 [Mollisia scopiformis]KUJ07606.1 hypothetical protein LY89DRAFT_766271 [Mollisia scopiformis]